MDFFDTERDLEDAGISAFEYSLMDEHERRAALEDAGLDADLYLDADQYASFGAWEELQDAGLSLSDLDLMDSDAIREVLADAGLDPSEYGCEAISHAASPAAVYPTGVAEPRFSDASPAKPSGLSEKPKPMQTPLDSGSQAAYQICTVRFPNGSHGFYRTSDHTIAECDYVAVPVDKSAIQIAMVVAVGNRAEAESPYPAKDLDFILRKAQPHEFTALRTPYHGVTAAQYFPQAGEDTAFSNAQKGPVGKKTDVLRTWVTALSLLVLVLSLVTLFICDIDSQARRSHAKASLTASYTPSSAAAYRSPASSSYSYSGSSRSTTPPRPPVNRKRAMTKEEADRLSGTGYGGTRPNSSAECIELNAAQVTCKNCGYHSDNGLNSLCDYCAWMERYGGGLPTEKLTTPRPASTPRRVIPATPKPTAKPDPFRADEFYDAEDFYEEYYDDFWDYEDAEDYWEEHQFD